MTRLLFLAISLTLLLTFTACRSEPEPEIIPIVPWAEAELTVTPDLDGPDDTDINALLGINPQDGFDGDDFEFTAIPIPIEDEDMDFDFGTPLELGNEEPDAFLQLETGMTLETGTEAPVDAFPITELVVEEDDDGDAGLVVEGDVDTLITAAEEELSGEPEELPKTNDMFSAIALAFASLLIISLLLLVLNKRKVEA